MVSVCKFWISKICLEYSHLYLINNMFYWCPIHVATPSTCFDLKHTPLTMEPNTFWFVPSGHWKSPDSQLMVNCWFGARWFGFLGLPYDLGIGDCYLGVSQNPERPGPKPTINHWLMIENNQKTTFKKIQATQICNVKLESYFNFQSGSRGGLDHNLTILFTTHFLIHGTGIFTRIYH